MTIIVTGGAGFIGGNFIHYHLKKHPEDRIGLYSLQFYKQKRPERPRCAAKGCGTRRQRRTSPHLQYSFKDHVF
jgi:nucleoside-diphosphate-sugar epimerase